MVQNIRVVHYSQVEFRIKSVLNQSECIGKSTCEWCTNLIFWPIVYLNMTNQCLKREDCTPSGSIFKNFYFPQYFPMHWEWSKTDFKQNSTCEWCTTLNYWPIVYLQMTNHCPKSHDCTPSGSIFKNFNFLQYFPTHSEWSKTDLMKN